MPFRKTYKKRPMRRIKKRVSRRPKKSGSTRIRRVVRSMAETKCSVAYANNQSIPSAWTGTLPFIITCTPPLTQGTNETQRIGNRVTITKALVEGYINLLPFNGTTNAFPDVYVRMMLVSYKNRNVTANSDPTLAVGDFSTYYEAGASGIGFQGNMTDIFAKINNERWTVHSDRIVRLNLSGSSTNYPATTQPHTDGVYTKKFKFYLGKHLGTLRFDDNVGSQYPTNKNLFLLIQPVRSDGGQSDNQIHCECHYKLEHNYKDM